MLNKSLLPFISNEDLYKHVKTVLAATNKKLSDADKEFHKNVIDPFSALFSCYVQGMSSKDWLEQEKSRQLQKTLENQIGAFHQNILASMPGWERLGGKADLINIDKKIIAEVKNKHNTVKKSELKSVYDELASMLGQKREYKDFTAYYVEIIPKSPEPFNKAFTPPDNIQKQWKPKNESIRVIDGKSFYELASGHKEALRQIYRVLPLVIIDIVNTDKIIDPTKIYKAKDSNFMSKDADPIIEDKQFLELFEKAYGNPSNKML